MTTDTTRSSATDAPPSSPRHGGGVSAPRTPGTPSGSQPLSAPRTLEQPSMSQSARLTPRLLALLIAMTPDRDLPRSLRPLRGLSLTQLAAVAPSINVDITFDDELEHRITNVAQSQSASVADGAKLVFLMRGATIEIFQSLFRMNKSDVDQLRQRYAPLAPRPAAGKRPTLDPALACDVVEWWRNQQATSWDKSPPWLKFHRLCANFPNAPIRALWTLVCDQEFL